jgi:exopolysaccharide biosynthesis polyprenyl glycosylphosphotransferase
MYRFKQLLLMLGDFASLYIGLFLAVSLRYLSFDISHALSVLVVHFSKLFLVAVVLLFINGLYDIGRAKNNAKFYQKILLSASLWIILGVFYFYVRPNYNTSPKTILLLTAVVGFGVVSLWRYIYNRFISIIFLKTRLVFVGYSEDSKEMIDFINKTPQLGYEMVGIISPENTNLGRPFFAKLEDIDSHTDIIILDNKFARDEATNKSLYNKIFKQIDIIELADFYEIIFGRIPPFIFSEAWFLTKLHEQTKKNYDRAKLIFDYLSAVVMAAVFVITFPIIAIMIKINSRGPIFYKQERVGRNGVSFWIYKYRTMFALSNDSSAETGNAVFASDGDSRITYIGKILRLTRLDEIPQFINILKNEMSVIGPRPERPVFVKSLAEQMPFYTLRHLIKPGLTGWAQLHKGYCGTMEENLRKLEYDLFYIKNRDIFIDAAITLKTINVILFMKGR